MVRCWHCCLDDIPKQANFCFVCGVPLDAFPKLQENHIPQMVPPPEKPSTSGSELEPEAAAKEELKTQQVPPPEGSQPLLARNNQPEVKAMPKPTASGFELEKEKVPPPAQSQPLLAESNRPEVKAMPKPSASGELEPDDPSDSQEVEPIPMPKPSASGCVSAEVDDAALAASANKDADALVSAASNSATASANEALTTVSLCVVDPLHRPTLFEDQVDASNACQEFGEILRIDVDPKASNATVWVTFSKAKDAQTCVQQMNGRCFNGKQLRATLHLASSASGSEFEQEKVPPSAQSQTLPAKKELKGTKRKMDPNDLQEVE